MFAVRNTLGKEQAPQNLAQQEKLKAVKARLNFEEASRYSESETSSRRMNLKERLGPRYAQTRSGSPKPRRGRSKSPREKDPKRRRVFKRLEKVVLGTQKAATKVLALKKQKLLPRNIATKESIREERKQRQKVKEVHEGTGSQNQRSKSRVLRTTYPNHGYAKKQILLLLEMPTWCHMFNSTLTENARVWFDDLPKESIDSYDDLRKAFLENYLQQKKCIKDPVEIHNIKQRNGNPRKSLCGEENRRNAKGRKALTFDQGIKAKPWKRPSKDSKKRGNLKKRQTAGNINGAAMAKDSKAKNYLGEEDGTEGPMIIEAEMGGHCVHRIYVDGGSSSEILFSGEIIWPLGQISLLVKIGDEEHSTSAWMNFMVVRSPSPYNGIIGRPWVRKILAIPSTVHEMIKFPVAGGIVTLRSSRIIPIECLMVSEPGVPRSVINQVMEEKIQVVIHPEYPKQTIAIGSTLTKDGRKEPCGLLRRHLDVFAWKPADMNGVPRHIAEHRLNVREGCLPVRQKKRGQAPERNKAISEEVKKLVEADIMKEVHYYNWLSNPVMVKKHDDS
nr:reverse transcriptase domain-containing protein [Tanacetum cinerariifolium]